MGHHLLSTFLLSAANRAFPIAPFGAGKAALRRQATIDPAPAILAVVVFLVFLILVVVVDFVLRPLPLRCVLIGCGRIWRGNRTLVLAYRGGLAVGDEAAAAHDLAVSESGRNPVVLHGLPHFADYLSSPTSVPRARTV